ncbi:MAG: hypothetical protein JO199_06105, partial [Candidatus Eremiobacteraeota bacterium]|nr:hypothetical protein [Candidatus Eremiobacteraeota bacterium]
EIGDKCAWTNLQNTQFGGTTLGTNEFPTQPLWSNAISGCTQSSSLTTPTPSPVPTATPIPGPTPTPGPFNNTVLGLNPLAFYQLNETSGTTVADSSGHGYNGTSATSIATLAAPGLFSGAQSAFTWTSPSNDQISLPSIPFTASSTVTFVVKAGTTQKAAFPVNYWNNGFGYYEGHPAMTGIYGNTCCHIYIDTHHTLQAGTAYLLTFVSNPSHRLSYISVNGSALTQMAGLFCRCAAVAAIDASKNAGFAGTNCPSNYDQYCSLSDVAIFPYALSQTQINSLATSSSLAVRAPGGSATRPRRGW